MFGRFDWICSSNLVPVFFSSILGKWKWQWYLGSARIFVQPFSRCDSFSTYSFNNGQSSRTLVICLLAGKLKLLAILPLFSLYYYYCYYYNNNVNGFLKTRFVDMKVNLIDNIHFVFYLIGHIKSQQN